jgi:hypothetical protein
MVKRLKRPDDPGQLAKLIGDVVTGQAENKPYKPAPDLATMDEDDRVLLVTRKVQAARAARRNNKGHARRSTKGK